MARTFTDWVRDFYPEVRLGSLVAVGLSLAFPPYAIDTGPGSTTFLGCHSLFTQEAGYVNLGRLVLFWLLVLVTAIFTQLNGQRCSVGLPPRAPMFFGRTDGAVPLGGTTLLTVILAIPLWLFMLGLVLGRERVLGLESHLAYFACAAFQLVVLSRLLVWLSREQTNLVFGYLILCAASLAWDLRTSPAPQAIVGGLVPLYALLGYLLYRFDLRFVVSPTVPAAAPSVPSPPVGPDTNLVAQPCGPLPSAPSPEAEEEPILESEAFSPSLREAVVPVKSENPDQPDSSSDPYDRYRPDPKART